MGNPSFLQETKQHGSVRFPFNIYPCTIPGDFPQVALHWQDSMEIVFVKRGRGIVQMGAAAWPAREGDLFLFSPGTLHALRQKEGCSMEYENIIFDLELLGGAGDLCAEKYILPLQSGRLSLTQRLTPNDLRYARAAACLREAEDVNRAKEPGYELFIKGALLRFLALLIAQGKNLPPTETADSRRLKKIMQWVAEHYGEEVHISDATAGALQREPFYAVVPANDRAELHCFPQGIPAQCRCRSPAHNGRYCPDHCVPLRVRESLLLQSGVQGTFWTDTKGVPKKSRNLTPVLEIARSAALHCSEFLCKVAHFLKTALHPDLRNFQICGEKQLSGFLEPQLFDILKRGAANHASETAQALTFTNVGAFRDLRQKNLFRVMFLNILKHPFHSFAVPQRFC